MHPLILLGFAFFLSCFLAFIGIVIGYHRQYMYKAFGPWIPSLGLGMIRYIRVLLCLFTYSYSTLLVSSVDISGWRWGCFYLLVIDIIGSIYSSLLCIYWWSPPVTDIKTDLLLYIHTKVDLQAQPRIVNHLGPQDSDWSSQRSVHGLLEFS